MSENTRQVEDGVRTDVTREMSYGEHLHLDELLAAQHPLSTPEHHDELLFIVQHQTSELWLELLLHELRSAMRAMAADDLRTALKNIARVKHIQRSLTEQWSVLATLTPTEYAQFREFQSHQYRAVEFVLGNENTGMLDVFAHDAPRRAELAELLAAPSLYDEFLRLLARRGHAVPAELLERDVTLAHVHTPALVAVFRAVYEDADRFWNEYEACEELVDLEENVQLWRFRHLKTVERTIGFERGTGGSSGVDFLAKALDLTFFPELYAIRTEIGS